MARTKNLSLDQGVTFSEYIYYLDVKTPISLSGYNVRSQMRRSYYSANAISFTTSVTDASNGAVQLSLESNITANLIPGRYVYDVEGYTGNIVIRISEGIVTVNPGVTK
jgi:hypothetical protein